MLFSSDIFIFLFLPIFLALFGVINSRFRGAINYFVLAASLVFYAFGNPSLLPVIVVSMLVNYGLAIWIISGASGRAPIVAGVIFNLGYLFAFKYACFSGLSSLPFWPSTVGACGAPLPLGVSFFTFQQMAYLIDLHRGTAPRKRPSFAGFASFVTFFPHLIAGPITRHNELLAPIEEKAYSVSGRSIELGLPIFVIGFLKKTLLADPLAQIANPIFEATKTGTIDAGSSLLGMLAFSGQIYFDFSGYSDMAVGIALMVGIVLPWNFARPYAATSIIDFWRRWHITLSMWLRDYLYIPLGGSRHGRLRRHLNLFITMLLGGLWHGAAFTFVAWGALHGLFLTINHMAREFAPNIRLPGWLGVLLVNAFVLVAWVFFRAETFQSAANMFLSLAHPISSGVNTAYLADFIAYIPGFSEIASLTPRRLAALAGAIVIGAYAVAMTLDTQWVATRYAEIIDRRGWWPLRVAFALASALVLAAGIYLQGAGIVSFIYFEF